MEGVKLYKMSVGRLEAFKYKVEIWRFTLDFAVVLAHHVLGRDNRVPFQVHVEQTAVVDKLVGDWMTMGERVLWCFAGPIDRYPTWLVLNSKFK